MTAENKKRQLHFVDCVDEVDLRTITMQRSCLAAIARDYDLKDGQAVAYSNKAHTRWRIVVRYGDTLHLDCPEVEDKNKYSVFLRIADWLAEAADVDTVEEISRLGNYTKERISRYKKRYKRSI